VRTDMPEGVTPQMWSWWFGWHGCDSRRYKLWHPRAHVYAAWQDGAADVQHYLGRTSVINEYIGSTLLRAAIRFLTPATMGFADEGDAVAVCARLGSSDVPVDVGWFVHHIRPTARGAEMRSRFWLGGSHIAVRGAPGLASRAVRAVAPRLIGTSRSTARDLMVHCAEEMNHLAGFLPALYQRFGQDSSHPARR
ncbi:MAG TPA: hypothetical protein VMU34_14060, partial [Mycobacterium sp.]|nr:hypothetical protein [Mycobacterium sp.]